MLCTHTAWASPLSCLCPFAVSPAVKWTGSVFLANGIANPYPAEPTTNAGRAAQFAPGANWQPVQIGFLRPAHSRPQTAAGGFLLCWGLCARPAREQVTRARGISDSLCAYNAAGTTMADKTALLITDIYQSDGEQARCEQIGALLDEYLRAMLSEGLAADGDIQ